MKRKSQHQNVINTLMCYYVLVLFSQWEIDYNCWESSNRNSLGAKKRRKKKRIAWSNVSSRISDVQFRRMFRMSRECFGTLCHKIACAVGDRQFKSESYIDAYLRGKDLMFDAHECTSGGYISGETKVAVTLRILAGGDSYDLGVIFDITSKHCEKILYEVLEHWIIATVIGKIDMEDYLNDLSEMKFVSNGFSKRSNGLLSGAIGAIDGWLVRIGKPSMHKDGQKNPTSFYSRKGFYALNVQCIVDHRKKVRWVSYSHKGASHDSSCFHETDLYKNKLTGMRDYLYEHGLYILGDSAYSLESFLLCLYLQPMYKSAEDTFNFYHSSARITVECAFGEIDLRWGIFWKRLMYSLEHTAIIIEGAMCLHNFLVDYRDDMKHERDLYIDRNIFNEQLMDTYADTLQVGNDDYRPPGRITDDTRTLRQKGLILRNSLCRTLADHDMQRPTRTEWGDNQNTHVTMF